MTVTTIVFQRIALVSVATAIVAALISPAPLADAIPRDQATVGSLSIGAHQDQHDHSSSPLALAALTLPQSEGKTVADQAPGGRAVAHYANGVLVRSAAVQRKAPVAQLFPTGTQAAEPTLGVDKDGTIFYVGIDGAYFDFNNPQDYKQEAPVVRSDDGGKTWQEISPMVGPQRRHAKIGLDPMLHVDPTTGRVFTVDIQGVECHTVSFSDDKGETWTTSQACGVADHQTVFTGPPATSTTVGYPNVVYDCAIDGGMLALFGTMTSCLKSLDGGLTWARTGAPAFHDDPSQGPDSGMLGIPGHCGGGTGHGVVDDKGTIYLPRGWCGQPWIAISKDEGRTWDRVQVATTGIPRFAEFPNTEEHESGVAVDSKGNLYYTWTGRNRLLYLATSTDGGKTWSDPMMVGTPGVKEAWGPSITVGAPGKIALAYIASTDAPGGKAPEGYGKEYKDATWNGYITMTTDALAKKPIFYTGSVNDPADPLILKECAIVRCDVQFDFIDVVIGPDGVPTTSMVDGFNKAGKRYEGLPFGLGIVGRLVGGPSLN